MPMPVIDEVVETVGLEFFLGLTSKKQNALLQIHLPEMDIKSIRSQKSKWKKRNNDAITEITQKLPRDKKPKTVKPKYQAPIKIPKTPLKTAIPKSPIITPDESNPVTGSHGGGGGLKTLNEAIVEDAIARVLEENPEKAISVAVNWVEKKGKISKEISEDEQSTEKQKKFYQEILKNVYT